MIELLMGAIPVALAILWRESYMAGRRSSQMHRLGLGNSKALIIDTQAIKLAMGKLELSSKKATDGMDDFYRSYYSPIVTDPKSIIKMTGVSA